MHWKKPWLAGQWVEVPRWMTFEWNAKRAAGRVHLDGDCLVTMPIILDPWEESAPRPPGNFDRLVVISGDGSEFETIDERMLYEGMTDAVLFCRRSEMKTLAELKTSSCKMEIGGNGGQLS
jgi:hypothetical protein